MFQALLYQWGCSFFGKGHTMLLPGETGWLGPPSSSAPLVSNCPGHLLVGVDIIFPPWWESAWGPFDLALGYPQWEVSWGSPQCPEDWDLLHQQLLEHWQLLEWLILSILSSRMAAAAKAHRWVSLMRAIIALYESQFVAVNFSYVLWFASANAVWRLANGCQLATASVHPPAVQAAT